MPTPMPPEGHVKVRSCDVTREMLREWGFPCRDCPTGHGTITTGPSFESARHEAWGAGFTILSSHREHERTWTATGPHSRENVTTILAELRACGIA